MIINNHRNQFQFGNGLVSNSQQTHIRNPTDLMVAYNVPMGISVMATASFPICHQLTWGTSVTLEESLRFAAHLSTCLWFYKSKKQHNTVWPVCPRLLDNDGDFILIIELTLIIDIYNMYIDMLCKKWDAILPYYCFKGLDRRSRGGVGSRRRPHW